MSKHIRWLGIIVVLVIVSLWIVIPREADFELDMNDDGEADFVILAEQPLGLDIVGGLRVLLQATIPADQVILEDLINTANNISRRVNGLGLSEATVQVQGNNRVLIELPGVFDRDQAIDTIRQTALLEFVDFSGISNVRQYVGQRILTDQQLAMQLDAEELGTRLRHPGGDGNQPFHTGLTGAAIAGASANIDQTGDWLIGFEIKNENDYVATFSSFTASMIGEPMAIVLDGVVISAPTVQGQLGQFNNSITGNFSEEEARTLALQLRSGALSVPLKDELITEVDATLGQEAVARSIKAGIVGVIVVLAFMLIYYRVPGISADIALVVFILLNMALFKLLPVTLTLPAISGFLISIGTAVDGNILIFERIKEELRAGKEMEDALDSGFERAWASIRDSNLSTIIICGILFLFGQTPGASVVSGFAVTLALGLILNLFTAITVTRTFLYLITSLTSGALARRKWLLGV